MSEARQSWRTPPELFEHLSELWGPFRLDACACPESALVERYNTETDYRFSWRNCSPVFCNPPFSKAAHWARYARDRWIDEGCRSVLILPSSANSKWWHEVKNDAMSLHPSRRIQFLPPNGVNASTNSRDCVLLLFGYGVGLGSIDLPSRADDRAG